MKNVRVAALQLCAGANLETNLALARRLLHEAKQKGAELAVLPEMFPLLCSQELEKLKIAEQPGLGPIQKLLYEAAVTEQLWIVSGTIPLKSTQENKIRAASLLINPLGETIIRYDKIFLFDAMVGENPYQESKSTEPGDRVAMTTTPFGQIGLTVCYDLRFSTLFHALRLQGAEIIINAAAFTDRTGQDHWEILLRARAIESQAFVIASNQWGEHEPGRRSFGHSMIIDPWGRVLAHLPAGDGVIVADLDATLFEEIRLKMPMPIHHVFT